MNPIPNFPFSKVLTLLTYTAIFIVVFTIVAALVNTYGATADDTPVAACPVGDFDPARNYVAPKGTGYRETGGTSTSPVVANAYDYGVLYAGCPKNG